MKKGPPKLSGLVKTGIIDVAAGTSANPALAPFDLPPPKPLPSAEASLPGSSMGGQPKPETARLIPISYIDVSRFQNRLSLTEDRIAALAENIRQDGLNNPIIVRVAANSRYELIAGETRMRACQRLGHQDIPAFVRDMDDVHSARSTVLDNFFHESLTDFEIYKGLETLLEVGAATSIRKLADITPWEKSHVQRLMAFKRLPTAVVTMLEQQPGLIGGAVAETLAGCEGKGVDPALVVKAVERIRDGKISQTRALDWIETQAAEKKHPRQAAGEGRAIITTAEGSALFTVDRSDKGIKIKGAKGADIDWDALHAALVGLLKSRAGDGRNINGATAGDSPDH